MQVITFTHKSGAVIKVEATPVLDDMGNLLRWDITPEAVKHGVKATVIATLMRYGFTAALAADHAKDPEVIASVLADVAAAQRAL